MEASEYFWNYFEHFEGHLVKQCKSILIFDLGRFEATAGF